MHKLAVYIRAYLVKYHLARVCRHALDRHMLIWFNIRYGVINDG